MSLGVHVGKKGKLRDVRFKTMRDAIIEETSYLNLSAVQLFTHGPRNKDKNSMDYQGIKKYCEENNIVVAVHGTYISTAVWEITHETRGERHKKMYINHIRDTLVSAKQVGAVGVVIHLPKGLINQIVEVMEILSDCHEINNIRKNKGGCPTIILEMPASKPDDKTYETAEKLNALVNALHGNSKITIEWHLCIDTAHQWSCGIKMSDPNIVNSWFNELLDITRDKIKLIHFNGANKINFGRGKDIHEIPMSPYDGIWHHIMSKEMLEFLNNEGDEIIKEENDLFEHLTKKELQIIRESSFGTIVHFAKKNNIPMIMEINRGELIYTKFAADIINGLLK
jgi:endonuclease IV